VAKRKDSIALFEVIKNRRDDANLNVPKWMGDQDPASQQESPEPPQPQPGAAPKSWSRIVPGSSGQLLFRLNYTHCILAAVGLVVVLVAAVWIAYAVGTGSQTTVPATPGPMAGKVPVGQHVLGGSSGQPGAPVVSTSGRVQGKYYLVVQALVGVDQKDLAEAGRIATWCKENGENVTVAKYTHPNSRKQRYIVWSLRPFDSSSGNKTNAFARKMEALGKKYFKKYRTYDFRQQMASGKFDPWYEKYQ